MLMDCHVLYFCSPQRKTPERQLRGASRLGPDSSPVAAAAAAAQGVPQAQRRRSCEEEGDSLVPKQLFVGAGAGTADSQPTAPGQQVSQQAQQGQACKEWAAFKAFMSSPRRLPTGSSGSAPASAMPQPAERPQQAAQQAQQAEQPMDVDSSQQGSPIAAAPSAEAEPAVADQQQSGPVKFAAGGAASSSASRAAAAPLSPRQAALAGTPPELTPEKLLPGPGLVDGLHSTPVDKENGSSLSSWAWGSSLEAEPARGPAAAAAPANRSRPHAAVRRGLLVLESPATERAAAAREKMAAEAAEVLAADVLRLLRWVLLVGGSGVYMVNLAHCMGAGRVHGEELHNSMSVSGASQAYLVPALRAVRATS